MHYVIIAAIIAVIVLFQVRVFNETLQRLNKYKNIFPNSVEKEYRIGKRGIIIELETDINEKIKTLTNQIEIAQAYDRTDDVIKLRSQANILRSDLKTISCNKRPENEIWQRIVSSINRYLEKNKGSISDFNLIKDIADRNCDAEEEAIQTNIPIPLYYGLMGTMAGIIVGVGYLWLSGGLRSLLGVGAATTQQATNGIVALLGGVALAMICSIIGIILTTIGATRHKDTKRTVEEEKHTFLSWIQAELLPKLSNDFADVLNSVTANLTHFNDTFSQNASNLHTVLNDVYKATEGQSQLLQAINQLKISKVASANIEVYDRLKSCTDEIGLIAEQLKSSRKYLEAVRALNQKLDDSEQRTRAIEDMGVFFMEERSNIESMKTVLNQAIVGIQTTLHDAIEHLKKDTQEQTVELLDFNREQRKRLMASIDEQEKVLQQKTAEINRLVTNLSSIEKMVQLLDSSARTQTQAINKLAHDIRTLAEQKTSGTVTVQREKLPKRVRQLIIAGGVIICGYCLISLLQLIVELFR